MKAHLTKVSLALLSTVFLLGCQDMGSGPVGPEGLGPEFTHKNGEHGKPGKDDDRPTYHITVSGDILADRTLTRARRTPENLTVDVVELDLSFFDVKVFDDQLNPCVLGVQEQGRIQIDLGRGGDHLHLFFSFEFNGVIHQFGFVLDVPATWPPIPPIEELFLIVDDRQWRLGSVTKKDQQDACSGAGDAGEEGIDFTILIEPV